MAVAVPFSMGAATGSLVPTSSAFADPPPWAPAHGYRAKKQGKGKSREPALAIPVPAASAPRLELGSCNRELIAGLTGAAVGGFAGSQIGKGTGRLVATAAGTIIGYMVGGSIGRAMDQVDQACVGRALEHARTGETVTWRNPDNGGSYEVVPRRAFEADEGRYCREYNVRITVGGKTEDAHGTACRQPDGTWQTVSN